VEDIEEEDETKGEKVEKPNENIDINFNEQTSDIPDEKDSLTEVPDEEITIIEEETIQTKKGSKKAGTKDELGEKTISVKELTEKSHIKNRIEAAMFIAGRPVSSEELSIKLEIGKKQIEELIKELALDYMDRITSIEIVQVGEKYSMQIKPEYTEHVKKFTTGGLIPEAVMRTLTIIALKQPISKSLVVKMRGAGAYDHIKFLIDRGFIEQSKKGRSMDLETTDQFSDTFGLSRDKRKLKEVLIQQLGITSPIKSGDEEAEDQKARKEALNKKKEEGPSSPE
jgi:segregation and condensation protein B